jgi:hypothetical protein
VAATTHTKKPKHSLEFFGHLLELFYPKAQTSESTNSAGLEYFPGPTTKTECGSGSNREYFDYI